MTNDTSSEAETVSTSLSIGDDLLPLGLLVNDALIEKTVDSLFRHPESAAEVVLAATARLIHDPAGLSMLVSQAGRALDRINATHLTCR